MITRTYSPLRAAVEPIDTRLSERFGFSLSFLISKWASAVPGAPLLLESWLAAAGLSRLHAFSSFNRPSGCFGRACPGDHLFFNYATFVWLAILGSCSISELLFEKSHYLSHRSIPDRFVGPAACCSSQRPRERDYWTRGPYPEVNGLPLGWPERSFLWPPSGQPPPQRSAKPLRRPPPKRAPDYVAALVPARTWWFLMLTFAPAPRL